MLTNPISLSVTLALREIGFVLSYFNVQHSLFDIHY